MNTFNWHIITKVKPLNDFRVKIEFNDGSSYILDITPYFKPDSIFNNLKDKNTFEKVEIRDDGRSLVFPEEIDLCADSLWLKAHPGLTEPYLS
ncbi:MAG: hypothetical protein A2X61_04345 [Ignavibacteria bacterium GWB2_35_12]|nr:MAG: hypothetical protein A2X63_01005 [Ignavibacteria bacterium GWA2_35_8]OGU38920.1 MAG: hypothetical protein A2X61_04345 [Ignavibacteria bacterium GWB2_35_12]OGU88410.1 MAG: hypothetical protein A2220_05055 [Ignavibacteria bacterium RIFOXYA2_FULL_35_10]OGV20398.1 MAG: hypothetical protein A2475_12120 [Ignavibacteria bacterium RIFOXYC2_FULL_35_21]